MKRMSSKSTKRYEGKPYYWYGSTNIKASAETSAARLRAKGDLVRVEKITEPYSYGDRVNPASENYPRYFIWRRKA